MLAAMRDHMGGGTMVPQIPTAICNALRRIAVNDQICMEYADAGGVTVTMQVDTQRAAVTLAVTLSLTLSRESCLRVFDQSCASLYALAEPHSELRTLIG